MNYPIDGVGQVDELGVVAVKLGLLDLNDHLVVLVIRLRAGVLLVHMLRAATVVEDSDLCAISQQSVQDTVQIDKN